MSGQKLQGSFAKTTSSNATGSDALTPVKSAEVTTLPGGPSVLELPPTPDALGQIIAYPMSVDPTATEIPVITSIDDTSQFGKNLHMIVQVLKVITGDPNIEAIYTQPSSPTPIVVIGRTEFASGGRLSPGKATLFIKGTDDGTPTGVPLLYPVVGSSDQELQIVPAESGLAGSALYGPDTATRNALATAFATSEVIGLAQRDFTAGSTPYVITTSGLVILETAQWDAITGDVGGLVPGYYYLSAATPGHITRTAPSSPNYAQKIGVAVDATTMIVQPGTPEIAGGGGSPTVERINGNAAASPSIDVTFAGSVSNATVTLANGTEDGFLKTVVFQESDGTYQFIPANFIGGPGTTKVTFTSSGGSVQVVWDATTVAWRMVNTFGGTVA